MLPICAGRIFTLRWMILWKIRTIYAGTACEGTFWIIGYHLLHKILHVTLLKIKTLT